MKSFVGVVNILILFCFSSFAQAQSVLAVCSNLFAEIEGVMPLGVGPLWSFSYKDFKSEYVSEAQAHDESSPLFFFNERTLERYSTGEVKKQSRHVKLQTGDALIEAEIICEGEKGALIEWSYR